MQNGNGYPNKRQRTNGTSSEGLSGVCQSLSSFLGFSYDSAPSPASSSSVVNPPKPFEIPGGAVAPLVYILPSFLGTEDLINMGKARHDFKTFSKFSLFKKLAIAIVQGNQDEANSILEHMPELLKVKRNEDGSVSALNGPLIISKKHEIKDFLGNEVSGLTPFQVALCSGDVEMAEMMKPYFEKQEGGHEELKRQFNETFPNGVEAHAEVQENEAFDFNEILTAIRTARDEEVLQALNKQFDANTDLNKALTDFRQAFDSKSAEEQIFNPQHLLQAFNCYEQNYDTLTTWDKRGLFWRQVIGYVQRHLPACYLQAFAQGIYYLVEDGEQLNRNFEFPHDPGNFMTPDNLKRGLGFDWAALAWGQGRCLDSGAHHGWRAIRLLFARIMSDKKIRLGKITTTPSSQAFARCVIS